MLATGETIESYPEDIPYSSRLILGWSGARPIHVVAAEATPSNDTIIITVYEPDSTMWEPDFKRRKQ